jgi:hypothetical protein
MSSTAITTLVKMMETLPVEMQDRVVEQLREYICDLQDERRWDKSFQKTQQKLIAAARKAKQEVAEGKAQALDYKQL